jgi:uncharacterized protein YuzE
MDSGINDILMKVIEANKNWCTDAKGMPHDFQYDYDADILYLVYGEPKEAFTIPVDDPIEGVYLRVDIETHKIVGLDILSFRKRFLPQNPDALEVFRPLLNMFGNLDWRIQLKPSTSVDLGGSPALLPASASFFPEYIPRIVPDLVST